MRVDVTKVLFMGAETDRDLFFQKAQEAGVIEFIHPQNLRASRSDVQVQRLLNAIKILRSLAPTRQYEGVPDSSVHIVVDDILTFHQRLARLQEEEINLRTQIEKIRIFGDFLREDIEYIEKEGRCKFRYFYIVRGEEEEAEVEHHPSLIFIGSDQGIDYFISIEQEPQVYSKETIELKIDRPVGELQSKLRTIQAEIDQVEAGLRATAPYNRYLHHELHQRLNIVELQIAKECRQAPLEGIGLFSVEGWVPQSRLNNVATLCSSMRIYAEEVAILATDIVPTYLENKKFTKAGEDLVNIYDTPSTTDNDPSPWVLWSFILFFGMIVNDAGYGLVFLLSSLLLKWRFPKVEGTPKRMIHLATVLSLSCIIWGVMTTSFFGIEISFKNPVRELSVVDRLVEMKAEYHLEHKDLVYQEWINDYPNLSSVTNAEEFLDEPKSKEQPHSYPIRTSFSGNILFELALIIGVMHVMLSMLRNLKRHWAGAGWVIFMTGAYLCCPQILHATSLVNFIFHLSTTEMYEIGYRLLFGGFGLALLLAIIQKRVMGFLEVMVIIQILCDVLSYLRLYALGLAGMMMGETFNEMAVLAGSVAGVLIAFFGHATNMTMSVMGGVIHGLRLNFLEWYHYSFEGGGRNLKPLKLIKDTYV